MSGSQLPLWWLRLRSTLVGWFSRRLKSPHLTLGQQGEAAAAAWLRTHGYRILATNHRNSGGELDIIAETGDVLVFVEVKTRREPDKRAAVEAVDNEKRWHIERAATVFAKRRGWMQRRCRYDLIIVLWPDPHAPPTIIHYPHAFEARR